jgi:predicted protein tyrosine phosphatase
MLSRLRSLFRRRTRVLFLCSQNRLRSCTAETVFSDRKGLVVRSAGTLPNAHVRVDKALVAWADCIFGMEREHADYVRAHFEGASAGKPLVVLDIPDDCNYMQPELVSLLEARVAPHLREV